MKVPNHPIVAIICLAMLYLFVPPTPVGANNGSGGELQITIATNNTTMTWRESKVISATVLLNGTTLAGAVVDFRCVDSYTINHTRTDVNGIASMTYVYPQNKYFRSEHIIASVSYENRTSNAYLDLTIVDPPPTLVPGKDPRDPGAIIGIWLSSAVICLIVTGFVVIFGGPSGSWKKGGG